MTGEPFQVTARLLSEFHARALADGAQRAVVLILPHQTTIRGQLDGEQAYWHTMTAHLESVGVPFIDLTPPMVAAARRDGVEACFLSGHYSVLGNAVIADVLADALWP